MSVSEGLCCVGGRAVWAAQVRSGGVGGAGAVGRLGEKQCTISQEVNIIGNFFVGTAQINILKTPRNMSFPL